jgi:hypothetical protein
LLRDEATSAWRDGAPKRPHVAGPIAAASQRAEARRAQKRSVFPLRPGAAEPRRRLSDSSSDECLDTRGTLQLCVR